MNLSQANMESLQALAEGGDEILTVAYNPNTVTGTPEADATGSGAVEQFREDTADLVEVVYSRTP